VLARDEAASPRCGRQDVAPVSVEFTWTLPPEALDGLAAAIVERLAPMLAELGPSDRWPAFMSAETAAAYLDVSVERIRKLKDRREIPFIQEAPGHRVLFARGDLDAWMASMRRGGDA
jgi:excisionase family DNA binding protein